MGNFCSTLTTRQPEIGYELPQVPTQQPTNSRRESARTNTTAQDPRFEAMGRAPAQASSSRRNQRTALPTQQQQRPDLSNIDFVHDDIAIPRLKSVLKLFHHADFDLQEAADRAGLGNRIGEGACFGVSFEWAREQMRRPGSDLAKPGGHMANARALERAFTAQAEFEATLQIEKRNGLQLQPEIANSRATGRILNANGFDFANTRSGFDPETVAQTVSTPGVHIISLTGFNDGHAISVHSPEPSARDQRLTLFDPNAGEFKIHRDDAEYFLTALQARYNTVGWRYSGADVFSLHKA